MVGASTNQELAQKATGEPVSLTPEESNTFRDKLIETGIISGTPEEPLISDEKMAELMKLSPYDRHWALQKEYGKRISEMFEKWLG